MKEIAWDPTGERIAVSFVENASLVALYSVSGATNLDISHRWVATSSHLQTFYDLVRGFVQGPPSSGGAWRIAFCRNCTRGALLAVIWASGQLNFYPMYFATGK